MLATLIPYYLAQNGKTAQPGDWETTQATGQPEAITVWNEGNLGPQPTVAEVQAAALLPQAIAAQLGALEAFGLAIEQGGTTINGFHYDSDDATQAKMTAAYNLAQSASSPATFNWWMSNGWHAIPKAQILSDAPVLANWVEAVFTNLGTHYANISALTSVAAVQAYNFTTGWPAGT